MTQFVTLYRLHSLASLFLFVRTLTQEDHGDNQITLEDVTQLVSEVFGCCPQLVSIGV